MSVIAKALLGGGAVAMISLIAASNMGLLPFGSGDFLFLFVLATLGALYRPGWVFLLLILSLPLELMTLSPEAYGIDLRPYQFLEIALFLGLLIRFLSRRALPELPTFGVSDALLSLVFVGALLSLVNAPSVAVSAKLALVILSLFGLYVLSRIYLRSADDLKKVLPFALLSGGSILSYSLFQNARFLSGLESFQVMPGRPDGMLPEPDWLGMYLVFFLAMLFSFGISFPSGNGESRRAQMTKHLGLFLSLLLAFSVLLMTVSRSAWLGAAVSGAVSIALFAIVRRSMKPTGMYAAGIVGAFLFALALVVFVPLTRFDLSGRAESIASGDQAITVSCERATTLPEKIDSMYELALSGCRHIDLEAIPSELSTGRFITTVRRDDPNVNIRKTIYVKSWEELQKHPFLGIGWGSISPMLGTDGRGAGLNASNVFLEIWLGSGLIGLVGFVGFLLFVLVRAIRAIVRQYSTHKDTAFSIFVLSAVSGIFVFNLFNAGILLGFLWVLFAAVLVVDDEEEPLSQA